MTQTKHRIHAFKSIGSDDASILILGSMPSVASLNDQQYYAHPRNAFWPVMLATLLGQDVSYNLHSQTRYKEKIKLLCDNHIAVWDVLASCERPGSLDSDIDPSSTVANDFVSLLQSNTKLRKILFNGRTAERLFKQHCLPELNVQLAQQMSQIERHCLPSTSPAMASLRLEGKFAQWHSALTEH